MLPTERIALCTARLMQGRALTVRQVAEELEISHSGAAKLLARISRVLPIVVDEGDAGGVWRINSGVGLPLRKRTAARVCDVDRERHLRTWQKTPRERSPRN